MCVCVSLCESLCVCVCERAAISERSGIVEEEAGAIACCADQTPCAHLLTLIAHPVQIPPTLVQQLFHTDSQLPLGQMDECPPNGRVPTRISLLPAKFPNRRCSYTMPINYGGTECASVSSAAYLKRFPHLRTWQRSDCSEASISIVE